MPETPPLRLLFFDNSPVYGGHEVMTLAAVRAMAADPAFAISFLYWQGNERLHEQITEIENVEPIATPTRARRFQAFWNAVQRSAIRAIGEQMKAAKPDLVVVAQGDIEISSLGVHAAKQAGLPCVSYIPCPHTQKEMGAKLGSLRDVCNRPLYNLPDAFITICNPMADRLRERGTRVPIEIVYNGVAIDQFSPVPKNEAREALGLPLDKKLVGVAARVQFDQKGQDFFVAAMSEPKDPDTAIVIAGDGPDLDALKEIAAKKKMDDCTHWLEWQSDTAQLYSALDVLALPSRFEGFPLVMIESVFCDTPVIGSDCDGMQEFLPSEWRFRPGDAADFRGKLRAMLEGDVSEQLTALKTRARAEMTSESFAASFAETCRKLAAG